MNEKPNLLKEVKRLEWLLHLANERIESVSIRNGKLERDLLVRRQVSKVLQRQEDGEYYVLPIVEVIHSPDGIQVVVTA